MTKPKKWHGFQRLSSVPCIRARLWTGDSCSSSEWEGRRKETKKSCEWLVLIKKGFILVIGNVFRIWAGITQLWSEMRKRLGTRIPLLPLLPCVAWKKSLLPNANKDAHLQIGSSGSMDQIWPIDHRLPNPALYKFQHWESVEYDGNKSTLGNIHVNMLPDSSLPCTFCKILGCKILLSQNSNVLHSVYRGRSDNTSASAKQWIEIWLTCSHKLTV